MDMAALYARHKVPFVMGTTGGDRQKLVADTEVRVWSVCVGGWGGCCCCFCVGAVCSLLTRVRTISNSTRPSITLTTLPTQNKKQTHKTI